MPSKKIVLFLFFTFFLKFFYMNKGREEKMVPD